MKRIAVLLTNRWRGGKLCTVKSFCRLLLDLEIDGEPLAVVLGVPTDYYEPEDFADLRKHPRFQLRSVGWQPVEAQEPEQEAAPATATKDVMSERLPHIKWARMRPSDLGGYDYLDCDAWILHGPLFSGALIEPLRPFAIFSPDWIQRVVPDIISDQSLAGWFWIENLAYMLNHRAARVVFATTPKTVRDVISYAGVPADRVMLMPILFQDFGQRGGSPQPTPPMLRKYLIWTTNSATEKNHENAFRALKEYYEDYDGQLDVVITGAVSDVFAPDYRGDEQHPYWDKVRAFVKETKSFRRRLHFIGNLGEHTHKSYLRHAQFLWHNVIYDNGTALAIEAAQMGVRTLSADYPQMRYLCATFGINALFFPAFDATRSAAALKEMEIQTADAGRTATFTQPANYQADLARDYGTLVRRLLEERRAA